MNVLEWTDAMAYLLDSNYVPKLTEENDWRLWVTTLIRSATFQGQNLPNPYLFDDWRDWAERFNSTVELA